MRDDLREALNRGLHVANAWAIVRLCHEMLKSDDLSNPIVVLSIQAVVWRLASSMDGVPVDADRADRIDAHLLPAIFSVLDAAEGRQLGLLAALNRLARAHAETLVM